MGVDLCGMLWEPCFHDRRMETIVFASLCAGMVVAYLINLWRLR